MLRKLGEEIEWFIVCLIAKLRGKMAVKLFPANGIEQFYAWVKTQIKFMDAERHQRAYLHAFPHEPKDTESGGFFLINLRETFFFHSIFINGFTVVMNDGFFDGSDDAVRKYCIEHELYESWLWCKEGWRPCSVEMAHQLARRREFLQAAANGDSEKLATFYTGIDPNVKSEIEAAQKAAQRRLRF